MSDAELVKRLRWMGHEDTEAAADCIEQLVAINEALTTDLARSTRLISKMVPLSACGNYVFWDGVGDIELDHNGELRNRIEALEQHVADLLVDLPCGCGYDNPTDVCMKHLPLVRKLTEQLEAARADAKEAEAYAEELAKDQVDLCRQLIAAEDKLAKAVELLRKHCDPMDMSDADVATLAEIEGEKG